MTKNSVHLLFLGLSIATAIAVPIAMLAVAPIWIITARIQDWMISEN
jgi:hypothetical protein